MIPVPPENQLINVNYGQPVSNTSMAKVDDDIYWVPMAHGIVYLAAVVDWFSRKILSHRVSITVEADFCIEGFFKP